MTLKEWDMKFRTKGFSIKLFKDKFAVYRHNKLITVCRDELELETIYIVLQYHCNKKEYLYEYQGEQYTIKEIAEKVGICEGVVYQRLNKCKKIEDVFREKSSRTGKNIKKYLEKLAEETKLPFTTLHNRYYEGWRGEKLVRPKRNKI